MIRQYKMGSDVEFDIIRRGEARKLIVTLGRSPREPREMREYRDDNFEFTVRDITLLDLAREQFQEPRHGPVVEAVSEGGWAALGHLAVGDLLLAAADHPTPDVASVERIMTQIAAERPKTVVLRVRRGIHTLYLELNPKWPDAG